jgi:hypothetical protein
MADNPAGAPTSDTPAATAPTAAPAAEPTTLAAAPSPAPSPAAAPSPAPSPAATPSPAPSPAPADTPKVNADGDLDPAAGTEDWSKIRERIAKGDEKLSKRLARYSSVDSVVEALIAAQAKISDGTLKSVLPKDATPEQVAAWREENGIPLEPTGYDMTMPDGLIIGEDDKPIVDEFVKNAHQMNMTPAQAKSTVAWYLNLQERQAEELAAADLTAKEQGMEALAEAWGSEAKLNKNLIVNLINQAPGGEETANQILGARLADGTPLGSNPNVLRWLADVARTVNPTATVVPGSGANASQAIETEIATLEKMMGDKASDYWKGPHAEKNQARYRQLVTVQEQIKT